MFVSVFLFLCVALCLCFYGSSWSDTNKWWWWWNQWDRRSLIERVSQRGETLPWRNSRYAETSFILAKIVTLFSYVVWPSAMKFGVVRGLANWHLLPKFGELWFRVPVKPYQSFTDALVSVCFLFDILLNRTHQNLCTCFSLFFGYFAQPHRPKPRTWINGHCVLREMHTGNTFINIVRA